MTDFEQYKEHIEHTFNAYCKIVIRHTAINVARQRHKQQEREISLDYMATEKHFPFVTLDEYFLQPELTIEHPCAIGKDTVMLNSSQQLACRRSHPSAGAQAWNGLSAVL